MISRLFFSIWISEDLSLMTFRLISSSLSLLSQTFAHCKLSRVQASVNPDKILEISKWIICLIYRAVLFALRYLCLAIGCLVLFGVRLVSTGSDLHNPDLELATTMPANSQSNALIHETILNLEIGSNITADVTLDRLPHLISLLTAAFITETFLSFRILSFIISIIWKRPGDTAVETLW